MSDQTDLVEKVARVEERLTANEKSVALARESIEKRLEGMNEFRAQLNSQAATFVTSRELDQVLARFKEDKRSTISLWVSVVALAASILLQFVKT